MLPIINTPIETLQSKSVTELKAIATADMTKRDLLIAAYGSDKIITAPVCTYRSDNQIEHQVETIKDVETNALISTRSISWTYYPKGEVDEITITESNPEGKIINSKTIKHFIDGRQPEVFHDL